MSSPDLLHASLYPLPDISTLKSFYLDKPLSSLPTPSLILDRALVRRNCDAMLATCKALGVGFRAHVKSHKTLELSKLQIGTGPAKFCVSTLIEAENLVPLLQEYHQQGRECSLLYAVPLPPSQIPRLAHLSTLLPPLTFSILLDNPQSLHIYTTHPLTANLPISIYIKIDTGYARAGIPPTSPSFCPLLSEILSSDLRDRFAGFYSHAGHSYAGSSAADALEMLVQEFLGLEKAAEAMPESWSRKLVLTVGATPTATAAQNALLSSTSSQAAEMHEVIERLKSRFDLELHAGVYPLLDLQQVATHARPASLTPAQTHPGIQGLSKSNIALKVLVEITSTYTSRAAPEALISAGSLALGREPCKSYPGWGIVSAEMGNAGTKGVYEEGGERTGWIVGKVSQEHGILRWEGPRDEMNALEVGERVLVWPNHACVAGAGFGWYFVVDSEEGGERVVDVWVRWRGW